MSEDVPAALDRFDITGALETIWDRARPNRYVNRTNGAREGSRARGGPRSGLFWLADALGGRLIPVPAQTAASILVVASRPTSPGNVAYGQTAAASGIEAARRRSRDAPAAAKSASVIDTHAHLDALEDADGALVRAREAGVSRVITIGTGLASCRAALALATANAGVYAALGIDPHQAGSDEEHRVRELRELLGNERAVAVGETGLDYHYGSETKDEQRRLFEAQLRLARELRLPVVIHTREERRHRVDAPRTRARGPPLLRAGSSRCRARARLVFPSPAT